MRRVVAILPIFLTGCTAGVVVNRAGVVKDAENYFQADLTYFAGSSYSGLASGFSYAYRRPVNRHLEYGVEASFYGGFFEISSYEGAMSGFMGDVYGKLSGGMESFSIAMQVGLGIMGAISSEESIVLPGGRVSLLMGFGRGEPFTIGFTLPPAVFWWSVHMGPMNIFLSVSLVAMYLEAPGVGAGFGFSF